MPHAGRPVLFCTPPPPFWTGTVPRACPFPGRGQALEGPRSLPSLDAALTKVVRLPGAGPARGGTFACCGAAVSSRGEGRWASAPRAVQGVKNQEARPQKGQLLPLTGPRLSFREVLCHRGERDARWGQVGRRLQRLPVPAREGRLLQGRCGLAARVPGPR